MKNKQIVFTKACQAELLDAPVPSPGDGEVLIRTGRTLISSGTELSVLSGKAPEDSVWKRLFAFPYVAGYTNVGVVVECGVNVPESLLGKKVCSSGYHANYAAVALSEIRDIPDDIPDDCSIFFNLAEIAMHGVRRGEIKWGDSAAIYGAGILGQFAAQFCLMCGARKVFVIDVSDYRLGLLPKRPRLIPVNAAAQTPLDVVLQNDDGRQVDIVYELTGNESLIPREFDLLREMGTMVIVSSPLGASWFDFHDLCNRLSFKIVGAHNFSHPKIESPYAPWTNKRDCAFFFDMFRHGDIDMSKMISNRISCDEAPGIYQELLRDRGRFMGVVIDCED